LLAEQEAQLLQKGCAMLCVVEHFAVTRVIRIYAADVQRCCIFVLIFKIFSNFWQL